jgi:TetR/AcrR family transcriptional repressor of nem operon
MARPKEFDQNRVLEKAMELFWRQGYEATSMQDLVEYLGINRQSIYDTFGDKHALFMAALKHYLQLQSGQSCTILNEATSTKKAIRQVFDATLKSLLEDRPRQGCMAVNSIIELAPHDSQVSEVVAVSPLEEAFYVALRCAQAHGELGDKPRDLRALARFLDNSLRGLAVTSKAKPERKALEQIIEITLSVLD